MMVKQVYSRCLAEVRVKGVLSSKSTVELNRMIRWCKGSDWIGRKHEITNYLSGLSSAKPEDLASQAPTSVSCELRISIFRLCQIACGEKIAVIENLLDTIWDLTPSNLYTTLLGLHKCLMKIGEKEVKGQISDCVDQVINQITCHLEEALGDIRICLNEMCKKSLLLTCEGKQAEILKSIGDVFPTMRSCLASEFVRNQPLEDILEKYGAKMLEALEASSGAVGKNAILGLMMAYVNVQDDDKAVKLMATIKDWWSKVKDCKGKK